MVDRQGGLALVRDMPAYLQYQMATAIGREQPAGAGDQLISAGLGVGVGMLVPGLVREAMHAPATGGGAATAVAPAADTAGGATAGGPFCTACGGALPTAARFCPLCGRAQGGPAA
jgi:membrane protease subunit (stomatin/prohibitin family)